MWEKKNRQNRDLACLGFFDTKLRFVVQAVSCQRSSGSMQLGPLRHWQTGHARHMGWHWRHHRCLILPPAAGRMQALCILACTLTGLQTYSSHPLPEFSKHDFPPPGLVSLVHLRMRLHHRRSMQILPLVPTSKLHSQVFCILCRLMQARGKQS